jgi:hypothetical protein
VSRRLTPDDVGVICGTGLGAISESGSPDAGTMTCYSSWGKPRPASPWRCLVLRGVCGVQCSVISLIRQTSQGRGQGFGSRHSSASLTSTERQSLLAAMLAGCDASVTWVCVCVRTSCPGPVHRPGAESISRRCNRSGGLVRRRDRQYLANAAGTWKQQIT